MARARTSQFTTIRTEGGLLPADLLARVAADDRTVPGVSPDAYHLVKGERLNDRVTRSWNRLVGAWKAFAPALAALPEGDNATRLTRERWLLPLFEELGYGRVQTAKAVEVDGRSFAISHAWGDVPLHLVGARIDLDRRAPGVRGAAGASPHGLTQELLNRTDDHLWAMVSNGLRLRLLRDNASLTRQAFVEFDLETMFADEVFDDFVILWLTCHQSRVEGDDPTQCWLEQWTAEAAQSGTRARETLRVGVERAIAELGAGFLEHPGNRALKDRLRSGDLSKHDYYRQLLRVVYRLLFLFVAEDRDLLHPPGTGDEQRQRYARFYSLTRVRTLAGRRRGGPHPDQWRSLTVVFEALGRPDGLPALGLPALGSFLWSGAACPDLDRAELANTRLLTAIRHLAYVEDRDERVLRQVDYRNLGTEELGAIYEGLLEQHPDVNVDAATFELGTAAGNERKTTGSYYTPSSLISCLLDSALDPVLDEAMAKLDPESALLDLKVLDPACGSGHFLIAAGHRIAKRLAAVRSGDDEPSPDAVRHAVRDVVSHCLHGIDLNPMAVELCKVSLWMEAMEPGKPLGFLDHRIVRGNALLGATPELLEAGVPDEAFKPLTGDDKEVVTSLKKRNRQARRGQTSLFAADSGPSTTQLAKIADEVAGLDEGSLPAVQAKAQRWSELVSSPEYRAAVFAADTWCASFVVEKTADAPTITHETYRLAVDDPDRVPDDVRQAVETAADEYGFLHWHVAFLDAYDDGAGGFDVVLGNPPWEKVKLSEKEFFATRSPEIAALAGAKRKAAIAELESEDPELWAEFRHAIRQADGESHLLRGSGRFPLCGRGDVNTYSVFAEAMRDGLSPTGRLGVIVPTGIATDDTTKFFFGDCVTSERLSSLYDFDNTAKLFPAVDSRMKFCLLTLAGAERPVAEAEFSFFAHRTGDLDDPERRFTLSPDDLALINPNTRTAPVFRTRRDAEITKRIYRNVPVLVRDGDPDGNPWGVEYQRMFDMTNDSHLFRTADELRAEGAELRGNIWERDEERWLPLYEAKMVHHFNHRFGDYTMKPDDDSGNALPDAPLDRLQDPNYAVRPRYWVIEKEVRAAMRDPDAGWLLGFRDICRNTDERTMIAASLPQVAVGNKLPLLETPHRDRALLPAVLASFACDFVARQKIGGTTMNFFIAKQLAVLVPQQLSGSAPWAHIGIAEWLAPRVLELVYTAVDLAGFATDLGYDGPPFRWEFERRDLIRAELDAAFFHLYGLDRDEVGHVMDTFPIVCRNDERKHGEYRTKRLILERYDALAEAIATGTEYQTILDPPPADPSAAHPPHEVSG